MPHARATTVYGEVCDCLLFKKKKRAAILVVKLQHLVTPSDDVLTF